MERKRLKKTVEPEPGATPAFGQPVNDVELAHYEANLRIDKYQLDDDVSAQPRLAEEVADRYALAKSIRDDVKDRLKTVEAELSLEFRAEFAGNGAKAPSETQLAQMVQVHSRRKAAFKNFVEAERMAAKLEGMKDSYKDRSFMLREMCGLELAAYFGKSEYHGGDIAKRYREVEYERKRAETHKEAVERRRQKGKRL